MALVILLGCTTREPGIPDSNDVGAFDAAHFQPGDAINDVVDDATVDDAEAGLDAYSPDDGDVKGGLDAGFIDAGLAQDGGVSVFDGPCARGNFERIWNGTPSAFQFDRSGRFIIITAPSASGPFHVGEVYLHDRAQRTTRTVLPRTTVASIRLSGAISGDGRFVALVTNEQLAAQDTNSGFDVYRVDVSSNQPLLISQSADGRPGDAPSSFPQMNEDGSVILFESSAGNLGTGFANTALYIWKDRVVRGINVEAGGFVGSLASSRNRLNSAGTLVVFSLSEVGVSTSRLFTYDVQTNEAELVLTSTSAFFGDTWLTTDSVAADRATATPVSAVVGLVTSAPLTSDDSNGTPDGYVLNLPSGQFERFSVHDSGAQNVDEFGLSPPISLSADGRWASFGSFTPLADGAVPGFASYLRDRVRARTDCVSNCMRHRFFDVATQDAMVSPDGQWGLFVTRDQLVAEDVDEAGDLYLSHLCLAR